MIHSGLWHCFEYSCYPRERATLTDEERTFPDVVDDIAYCACRPGQHKSEPSESGGKIHSDKTLVIKN